MEISIGLTGETLTLPAFSTVSSLNSNISTNHRLESDSLILLTWSGKHQTEKLEDSSLVLFLKGEQPPGLSFQEIPDLPQETLIHPDSPFPFLKLLNDSVIRVWHNIRQTSHEIAQYVLLITN